MMHESMEFQFGLREVPASEHLSMSMSSVTVLVCLRLYRVVDDYRLGVLS